MEKNGIVENHLVEKSKDVKDLCDNIPTGKELIKLLVDHFGDTEHCGKILRIFDKDDLDKALADIHKNRKTPIIDSMLYEKSK